ncbi:MAG: hypothetical protein IJH20_06575 [Bacilli bacterium]|jgi:hypothetical protein|nr:hypothetical protein [Bacilli bacterium]
MIYTNLDTNNMVAELENHLKNITNKKYIQDVINKHYSYNLITKEERDYLYNKYMEV